MARILPAMMLPLCPTQRSDLAPILHFLLFRRSGLFSPHRTLPASRSIRSAGQRQDAVGCYWIADCYAATIRQGGSMHKYKLGRWVLYQAPNARPDRYEIVKLLPLGRGEPEYRIKNPREEHERVVRESELKPADDGTTNA